MVAGTFHVPSAIQKPLVFEATAHGSVPATFQRFHKLAASRSL
jgi:hypothetical protein